MLFDSTKSQCTIKQPRIVCEENRMKYVANNLAGAIVYKFQIDGDIITDNSSRRCDYLVENETKKSAYFVELKGCDISSACEQINKTIDMFTYKLDSYLIHSRIVCSRIATSYTNDSHYRGLKRKCPDVIIKTRYFDEKI